MSTRPITDALRHIQGGAFLDDASDQLREIVQLVDETGKPGKLTLEITVAKLTRGGAVTLKGKSKATRPAEPPHEAIFWVSPEGNLLTEDPHQQKLDLKVAPNPAIDPQELRSAT